MTEQIPKNIENENKPHPCVYLLYAGGLTKVGFTNNLDNRLKMLRRLDFPSGVRNFLPIERVLEIRTNQPSLLERQLHELLAEERVIGEWFFLKDKQMEAIKDLFQGSIRTKVGEQEGLPAIVPYTDSDPHGSLACRFRLGTRIPEGGHLVDGYNCHIYMMQEKKEPLCDHPMDSSDTCMVAIAYLEQRKRQPPTV